MMQTLLSWSGGKDSSLALAALREDPAVDVIGLLTTVTPAYDRVSIHGVRRELLAAQARSIGLPLYEVPLPSPCTNAQYERAFEDALRDVRARHPGLEAIAFGDLFLEDVRGYRERQALALGFAPVFPVWGRDTGVLAQEFVDRGFVAHLVCVDTTQLESAFAGMRFDEALRHFPDGVDPCGERGEFHTFVSAGPTMHAPVNVVTGERLLREERFMYCDLLAVDHEPNPD